MQLACDSGRCRTAFLRGLLGISVHFLANLIHAATGYFLLRLYKNASSPPPYLGDTPHSLFGMLDSLPALAEIRSLGLIEVAVTGCGLDLLQLAVGARFPERLLIPLLSLDPFLLTCLDPSSPVRFYREFTAAILCFACLFLWGRLPFFAACLLVVPPIVCHVEFLTLGLLVVYRGLVCSPEQQSEEHFIATWEINIGCLAVGVALLGWIWSMGAIGPIASLSDVANRSVLKKLVETDTFGLLPSFLLLVPILSITGDAWVWTVPIYLMVLFAVNLPQVSVEGEEYASVAVVRLLIHAGFAYVVAKQERKLVRLAAVALLFLIGAAWYALSLRTRALELVCQWRKHYYGVE
jgi:hypothetical protein